MGMRIVANTTLLNYLKAFPNDILISLFLLRHLLHTIAELVEINLAIAILVDLCKLIHDNDDGEYDCL